MAFVDAAIAWPQMLLATTTKSILCGISVLAVGIVATSAGHAEQRANSNRLSPGAASSRHSNGEDCETSIQKLDASQAEGEERLAEKNEVIERCATQYKNDKMIGRLVNECAKFEEQAVVKQQSVAECQLAAFNYANALHSLKADYGK
ncbi:MAG TPA: hypothetical protein VMF12_14720 [Xanthobacteraceae bacterium]|nr:hypothetical protein [Xanthobacteraceae bacterium]